MNRFFLVAWVVVALPALCLWAQDGGPTTRPTTRPSSKPSPETPLVTVDGKTVTQGDVDALLADVPEAQRAAYTGRALKQLIARRLAGAYVKHNKLPVDEVKLAEAIENVRAQMALSQKYSEATTDEKVKAYIAAHPHYFDGTMVTASHILIKSELSDSSADQMAARAKLEGIAKEISDGKITFAAAAKKYSEGPSREKAGDLGAFAFGGPMDSVFTNASFATGKGKVSGVVRTSFGWHLIRVTDVKLGDGKPVGWTDPSSGRAFSPEQLAKRALGGEMDKAILLTAARDAMVVNHRKKPPPTE